MTDYISREDFIVDEQKRYCENCDKRKGMKNGKLKFVYEIGDAPCRACWVDDMLDDAENYPSADVREVVHGRWKYCNSGNDMICSACERYWIDSADQYDFRYCPSCGARMDGESDES